MIEVWACGEQGVEGYGATQFNAEQNSFARAASERRLDMVVAGNGVHELTPEGDESPQFLYVEDDSSATLSELSRVSRAAGIAVYKTIRFEIGREGAPRKSLSLQCDVSDSGTPGLRVFYVVAHAESTPELNDFRALLSEDR